MRKFLFCTGILYPTLLLAGTKEHAWQTGVVLDTEHNRYFVGTLSEGSYHGNSTGNSYSGTNSRSDTAVYQMFANYVIDSGQIVYLADERLRWRWSKPANLIVNGPVKFYVDKRKLHILDEDGKEHEAVIEKQTLKQGTAN